MTPDALKDTLTQPWAHGEHAEIAGQRFTDAIALDGLTLRSFDLSDAVFEKGLAARGATFRGMAWLKRARVSGVCDLSGSLFRSDLRLDGLICEELVLTGARFEGVLDLDGARIGKLDLDGCLCLANVSLGRAVVQGTSDLSGSEMMGGLWAEAAVLGSVDSTGLTVEGRRVDL